MTILIKVAGRCLYTVSSRFHNPVHFLMLNEQANQHKISLRI